MESSEVRSAIRDIYDRFLILPNLRLHMFRTAAVAEIMCDNWRGAAIDRNCIIAACLLHDIGNIVKFDLKKSDAPLLGNEVNRLGYWRKVKRDTIHRYGSNDHGATHNMMIEIGVNRRVLFLVDRIGDALRKKGSRDYAQMLCNYADNRVSPCGVLSISDRFSDFIDRYSRSSSEENRARCALVRSLLGNALKVEERLFVHERIRPGQINDKSIRPYLDRYIE